LKLENSFASSVTSSAGIQSTSTFNIARTPHMFNILSSGLYSDKIAAVLREIGCNAMDAHIMYGTPERPIEVKLPTLLDPSFYVKDWGPGLDDEELRVLYTTYGWSSKQQSDDVTGAFGLGSKSPFAYTLQNETEKGGFSVESVKNGVKRIYTCYLDDTGAPAISRLYEGPCDEAWTHGVKVSFPVQTRDISEFQRKAAEVFRWFKVTPNVLGLNTELEAPEFKLSGSFFGLGLENGSGQPAVVMGGVRYPIRSERFNNLDKIETALLGAGIHLMLPMGSVMMTPSREELEYVEKTRQNVKAWLKKAAKEVAEQVRQDVFAESLSRWEWLRKVFSYYEALPHSLRGVLAHMLTEAQTPQEDINLVIKTVNTRLETLPAWLSSQDAYRVYHYARVKLNRGYYRVRRREVFQGRMLTPTSSDPCKIDCLTNTKVVVADTTLPHERLRAQLLENAIDAAVLIWPKDKTMLGVAKAAAERLVGVEGIEGMPLMFISEMGVPQEVLDRRAEHRTRGKQSPKQVAPAKHVHVYSPATGVAQVPLSALDTSQTFYMLTRDCDNPSRRGLRNTQGHVEHCIITRYDSQLSDALRCVMRLMAFMGQDFDNLVLVKTENQAEKLKLAELGIRPLLPVFFDLIDDPQNQENLRQVVLNHETGNLLENYFAQRHGVMGLLAQESIKNTQWWTGFSAQLKGHALLNKVEAFKRRVSDADTSPQALELTSAVQSLLYRLTSPRVNAISKLATKAAAEDLLEDSLYRHFPMMKALSPEVIRNWVATQPEKATNALLLGVMLYNTVEVSTVPAQSANEDNPLNVEELQAA